MEVQRRRGHPRGSAYMPIRDSVSQWRRSNKDVLDWIWDIVWKLVGYIKTVTLVLLVTIIVTWALFTFAVVIYSFVYYVVVPTPEYAWPVYFNFEGERPTTFFPLQPSGSPLLRRHQPYDFDLKLVVPSTFRNINAGMFMATIMLMRRDDDNTEVDAGLKAIASISSEIAARNTPTQVISKGTQKVVVTRPGTLKYYPYLAHLAWEVVFLVPLMVGLMQDTQTISIRLAEDFEDKPPGYTWVGLSLSKDLDVYSAELIATAKLHGLSYWMYHWYFSSMFIGVCVTTCTLGAVVAILYCLCAYQGDLDHMPGGEDHDYPEDDPRDNPKFKLDPVTGIYGFVDRMDPGTVADTLGGDGDYGPIIEAVTSTEDTSDTDLEEESPEVQMPT